MFDNLDSVNGNEMIRFTAQCQGLQTSATTYYHNMLPQQDCMYNLFSLPAIVVNSLIVSYYYIICGDNYLL